MISAFGIEHGDISKAVDDPNPAYGRFPPTSRLTSAAHHRGEHDSIKDLQVCAHCRREHKARGLKIPRVRPHGFKP